MHDKRVVRGSTIAGPVISQTMQAEIERRAKEEEERMLKRMNEQRRRMEESTRARTPEPVAGRSHADIQTETFLEVLTDRMPEEEVGVQTDALMDRPPSPLFIPRSSGIDAVTQIELGDLFDFDHEAAPLLEVLVGKTLENALMEVLQEDEMAAIKARQEEFEQVRNAELAELQRMEAEVRRRAAEKERRVQQERLRVQRQTEVQQKVAAAAFARSYLAAMRRNLFSHLHSTGYFFDPLRREIETQVLPGVFAAVEKQTMDREQVARQLADDVILNALKRAGLLLEAERARVAAEKARMAEEARKAAEEAAAKAAEEAARLAAEAAKEAAEDGGAEES